MAKSKTTFMVVTGASVGVVRDGKRKTLVPGQGEEFTEEEIATINKAVPGALRKAINEGVKTTAQAVDDSDDDDADDETETKAPAKKSAAKKSSAKKAPAKKAEKAEDADEDADADEDEDI